MNTVGCNYLYKIQNPQGEVKGYLLGSVHRAYQSTIEKILPIVKPLLQECSHLAFEILKYDISEIPSEFRAQNVYELFAMLKDIDEASLGNALDVLNSRTVKLSQKKIEREFYQWFSACLKHLNDKVKKLENIPNNEKVSYAEELEACKKAIEELYSQADDILKRRLESHLMSPSEHSQNPAIYFLQLLNLVRNLSQDKYCQFESSIQHEAQTHQLLALESSEEHSLGFDDSQITEEKEYIKQFIANPSKATLQNLLFDKSLIDKWENNEITAAEVTSSSQKESLDARSVIQANSIHKFITSNPSKLFAVVGAQHLFGEKGVVSQLRAKGWSVN